ncbi:NAD(P)-dependent dehydrogenase (short-subunit alcohol dehydrogenase family) [Nonomuraea thailandensis]|uniref:NAD(P)-dependent dehydrogenase (Short-subunit alcohol dehydrogenase family) n=1 Tax=Nonomuraea thailandensis TaxID=1188745 RepID=A0A9X2GCJ7_9ACTN|nr:SDR family oxidoreductase [Nonomuraea thailandensis]MCP2354889.1 NAD(P)-dependent dehydrogenase (short-subunit alcohol dehydrogenase family) [Nonomuraea thailandensis]
MLLDNKVAIVHGAGGSIGGAVARAFAREGARVFLAGRTRDKLDELAAELPGAEAAVVDALDEAAVDTFTGSVAERAGRIDVCFNAIGIQDVQRPLDEISAEEFLRPIEVAARTQFLTTRAAVRHMVPRRSGVILMFGGGGPQTQPGLGGLKVALDAMESMRRQWACEYGPHGIRVLTLVTGGIPESLPVSFGAKGEIAAAIAGDTLLKRAATLGDVGDVAAFAASDLAGSMTSATLNISCGAIVDH